MRARASAYFFMSMVDDMAAGGAYARAHAARSKLKKGVKTEGGSRLRCVGDAKAVMAATWLQDSFWLAFGTLLGNERGGGAEREALSEG
mmetsp:Transcript_17334/g.66060  ORF Transcript_17334/g.66060 Transcript_17334/m.66060 type:complete len:89 (+) Transcript_17334:2061-2327(+)